MIEAQKYEMKILDREGMARLVSASSGYLNEIRTPNTGK